MASSSSYDVAGKTIFVTGAARGIGLETTERMLRRGANVAMVGLEPAELERQSQRLGTERTLAVEADVTDRAALDRAVEQTVARFGGIDVAVANAGIATVGSVASIAEDDFERVIEVNLLGVWRTVRAVLPHVVERRGYVLPIASLAAVMHQPLMASYTASKAGVEAFTDALRLEVAHTGTKVGCGYFGFIDTDMVRDSFANPAAERMSAKAPGMFVKPIPLSRAGDAIEKGILKRSRIVYAPGWLPVALGLRGVLQPLSEIAQRRRPEVAAAVRLADEAAAGGEELPNSRVLERNR